MVRVLIFRPNFDIATKYGHYYLGLLASEARLLGHHVIDLEGDNANFNNFSSKIRDVEFFIGLGHGDACYTPEHEVLTEDGWIPIKELVERRLKVKVATLNPETGELEYHYPIGYYKFRYKGKMLLIEGKRVSLCVTPNHRLYVSYLGKVNGKVTWKPYKFIEAKDIGKHGITRDGKGRFKPTGTTRGYCLKFKASAKWSCSNVEYFTLPSIKRIYRVPLRSDVTYTEIYEEIIPEKKINIVDWLRFFGIWLAEGTAAYYTVDTKRRYYAYLVAVYNNDLKKLRIIKRWFDRVCKQIGVKCRVEISEHSSRVVCHSKQLYEYLSQFGKSRQRYIPKEIKMLPPELLKELLFAMILGDGSNYEWYEREDGGIEIVPKRGNYVEYSTFSKRLADDVQEIALKCGYSATVVKQKTKKDTYYQVNIHFRNIDPCVTRRCIKWIDYDGYVYCIEVPNHLIYVRRNGKPVWCGNSVFSGQYKEPILNACTTDVLMDGRTCYLLSCNTGVVLGLSMVQKGCIVYSGYNAPFMFLITTYNPRNDEYAEPFFEFALTLPRLVLRGYSFIEAYNRQIEVGRSLIEEWSRVGDDIASLVVLLLTHNLKHFVVYGNPYIRLVPTPIPIPLLVFLGLLSLIGGITIYNAVLTYKR